MVRKLVIALFLLIPLFVITVYAKPLYEGNLFNGENFTIGNDSYKIAAYGDNEYWMNYSTVVFRKNSTEIELFTAKYANCAYTEYYEYCYDYSYYDFDKKQTYESTRIEPLMHIRVEYLTPIITITRPATIALNHSQSYQITTKLKNTGNNDVLVDYVEELPIGLFASDCTGCTIIDNVVKKKVTINDGEEISFTYNIITYDYDTKEWNTSYTYTIDTGVKRSNASYKATVNTPFKFTESLSKKTTTNLKDYSIYTLLIINLDIYKSIDAKIFIDSGDAIILESKGLENTANKYFYEGKIPATNTVNFTLKISSKMIGTFPIITNTTLKINDITFYNNTKNTFIVNTTGITPNIYINRVKLVPGDNISLSAWINNTANDVYYNIFGRVTGLSEEYIQHTSISPKSGIRSYNTTYTVPELPNKTVILFTFTGTYNTAHSQELTFYAEKKLTVESVIPAVIINTTNTSVKQNTTNTANTTTSKDTTAVANKSVTSLQNNPTSTLVEEEEKTDFLSRFFNRINKFFANMFGKK